jgi:hypothetical protein
MNPLEMEQAVQAYLNEAAYQLADGHTVCNGFFSVQPRISGVFDSSRPTGLVPERNTLSFSFRKRQGFNRLLKKIEVKIEGPARDEAYIDNVFDSASETFNTTLSPGGAVRVSGSKIRIQGVHQDVGLYFVDSNEGRRIKFEGKFLDNTAGRLSFVAPSLNAGDWRIEICTQFTNGKALLKEPRVIRCPFEMSLSA